jgi:hypothetical protein
VRNRPLTLSDPSGFADKYLYCRDWFYVPNPIHPEGDPDHELVAGDIVVSANRPPQRPYMTECWDITGPDEVDEGFTISTTTSGEQGTKQEKKTTTSPQDKKQPVISPYLCAKFGIQCEGTPPDLGLPCFGTFEFAGREADAFGVDFFAGQLLESSVEGLDAGPLLEASIGNGGVVGVAVSQSLRTGEYHPFGFAGAKLSSGPLAGVQAGVIFSPTEFGFYLEGHKGFWGLGVGAAFFSCGGH